MARTYLRKSQIGTPAEAFYSKNKAYLDGLAKGRQGGRISYRDMPKKDKERGRLQRLEKKGSSGKAIRDTMNSKDVSRTAAKSLLKDLYSFSIRNGGEPHTK